MKKMLLGLGALACLASVGAGVVLNRANANAMETKATDPDTFVIRARLYGEYTDATAPTVTVHLWQSGSSSYTDWDENSATMAKTIQDDYVLYTYNAPWTYNDGSLSINRVIFRSGGKQSADTWLGGYMRQSTEDYGFTITIGDSSIDVTEGYYADSTFDQNKARLWVNRNGYYNEANYSYVLVANGVTYPNRGYVQMFSDGTSWPYFDIDKSNLVDKKLGYAIYMTKSDWFAPSAAATDVSDYTYSSGDNIGYMNAYWSGDANGGVFDFSGSVSNVLASAFPTILQGYFTCSGDKDNGFGNFGHAEDAENEVSASGFFWYWNPTNANGDLSETTFQDFAYEEDGSHDYSKSDKITVSCQDKIDQLASYYSNWPAWASSAGVIRPMTSGESNSTAVLVLTVCALASVSVAGVLFYAKKRSHR